MSRRSQLRKEAAQVRGQIDRCVNVVHWRMDQLICQAMDLARSPAALPSAFLCGMLVGHQRILGIKEAYRLLTHLASQVQRVQIASSLEGSSIR